MPSICSVIHVIICEIQEFCTNYVQIIQMNSSVNRWMALNTLQTDWVVCADDSYKMSKNVSGIWELFNFVTIFEITMTNAFKWVQTCLVFVQ